jgi:hypothetical protein
MSASNKDWQLTTASNLVDLEASVVCPANEITSTYYGQSIAHKFANSPGLFLQTDAAEKMMRNAFGLFICNLVRDDRQTVIQLHRISIDNFAIEFARDLDGQLPAVISTCNYNPRREILHLTCPCLLRLRWRLRAAVAPAPF